MRKKEPLLPVLILGLLAFTVLWPLWFTVGGALMASDELTAALGPALLLSLIHISEPTRP